jgi:hypothetical protein
VVDIHDKLGSNHISKRTVFLLLLGFFVRDSLPILCLIPSLVFIFAASRTVQKKGGGVHGRDCMVVGFTTTCAISAYY